MLKSQLTLAQRRASDIGPLLAQGFVTQIYKDQRDTALLTAQQNLIDIQRQIDSKLADAADTDAQIRALPTTNALDLSQLRGQEGTLRQALAELEVQDTMAVSSRQSGRITAVNVHVGDAVNVSAPLFSVAPLSGKPQAELLVPTGAAGFVAPGQEVRLGIDTFPSNRFGQIEGRITTVSRSAILPAQVGIPLDVKVPVYRVIAALATDHVDAYGKPQKLQPGMTLQATVITSNRTFFQWLFDPIVAAGRDLN